MLIVIYILAGLLMSWLILGGQQYESGVGRFLTKRHISGLDGNQYLIRRYLLPRNKVFNIYLHQFLGSDDDRALHDHPWYSFSIVLKGTLIEHLPDGSSEVIGAGRITFRAPTYLHRIELPQGTTAWTIFVTGPVLRNWGFVCPTGWVAWKDYRENGGCQ